MIVTPKKILYCTNCKKQINKNHLSTPMDIFTKCEDFWNKRITFDLCATPDNTRTRLFYSEKHNFLKMLKLNPNFVYWCNPPHDQTKEFVMQCFKMWYTSNVNIIMLIPINTLCSNYARRYLLEYAKFKVITGRIKFCCPHCGTPTKLNSVNGYVSVLYEKRSK